jgi:hypothetical protein
MKSHLVHTFMALTAIMTLIFSRPVAGGSFSRGGTFLPLGWDARGEGLAGAATLLIRDDRSAYWNPANLTFTSSPRATLSSTKPVPDLNNRYTVLSMGMGLFEKETPSGYGYQLNRYGVGFTVTNLGLELAGGSKWTENTFGISAAFAPNHYNSLGFSFRYMKSHTDISNADASGMAADLGWTAQLREKLWIALVGRNFFSSVSYPENDQELDSSWIVSLAYQNFYRKIFSVECDAVWKRGELNRILAGTEAVVLEELLRLLAGVDIRFAESKRTILHTGLSTLYRSAEISLAFTFDPEDSFGRQNRVSVSYSF